MERIVFATQNEHKMDEIRMILADIGLEILSMKEVGIDIDIVEDGDSFEANALLKVKAISKLLPGDIILADDSGLEIDYLNKEPGIYSARYGGEDTSYTIKNQMLLDRLEGVSIKDRTARFVCAIAAAFPKGEMEVVRGTVEGYIGDEPRGTNGFGYDPIFYVPEFDCSTAEMEPEQKNAISHRGDGLRKMKSIIVEKL